MTNLDCKYGKEEDYFILRIRKLTRLEYDSIKPLVSTLNGHWRELVGGFVFHKDVSDALESYMDIIYPIFEKELTKRINDNVDVDILNLYEELDLPVSKEQILKGRTQFFPTPINVAKRMVQLVQPFDGMSILEPSAGTGNLINNLGVSCNIVAVEPWDTNYNILKTLEIDNLSVIHDTFENVCQ